MSKPGVFYRDLLIVIVWLISTIQIVLSAFLSPLKQGPALTSGLVAFDRWYEITQKENTIGYLHVKNTDLGDNFIFQGNLYLNRPAIIRQIHMNSYLEWRGTPLDLYVIAETSDSPFRARALKIGNSYRIDYTLGDITKSIELEQITRDNITAAFTTRFDLKKIESLSPIETRVFNPITSKRERILIEYGGRDYSIFRELNRVIHRVRIELLGMEIRLSLDEDGDLLSMTSSLGIGLKLIDPENIEPQVILKLCSSIPRGAYSIQPDRGLVGVIIPELKNLKNTIAGEPPQQLQDDRVEITESRIKRPEIVIKKETCTEMRALLEQREMKNIADVIRTVRSLGGPEHKDLIWKNMSNHHLVSLLGCLGVKARTVDGLVYRDGVFRFDQWVEVLNPDDKWCGLSIDRDNSICLNDRIRFYSTKSIDSSIEHMKKLCMLNIHLFNQGAKR